jgi:DNA polymerase iota
VWRLVYSLVGASPEKLGMDELFVDATPLIDAHLASPDRARRYLTLSKPCEPLCGFAYVDEVAGVPYGSSTNGDTEANLRLVIGSHLAAYIRDRITGDVGFTTSAGIAPTKLLAKLLASENKPSKQTTWLPPAQNGARQQAAFDYLGPLPIRKCVPPPAVTPKR